MVTATCLLGRSPTGTRNWGLGDVQGAQRLRGSEQQHAALRSASGGARAGARAGARLLVCASQSGGTGPNNKRDLRTKAQAKEPSLQELPDLPICGPDGCLYTELMLRNEYTRLGGEEAEWVQLQASKLDISQRNFADVLLPLEPGMGLVDVTVVGCGPAGVALAAELGKQGLQVALVGPDLPFVNTYGVWVDEFEALGLAGTLGRTWPRTLSYFDADAPTVIERMYGVADRNKLREELMGRCLASGNVRYKVGELDEIRREGPLESTLVCMDGSTVRTKFVVVATGAAAGKFIEYDDNGIEVAAQTAYGIEAEVEGYPFDQDEMLFMDYRRQHAADAGAGASAADLAEAAGDEVPSFLYAMSPDHKNRAFLQETCLATRPALPFEELKRRLYARCEREGIKIVNVVDEEWSHIPLGGPLPKARQEHVGFGAAANLVHPATGYSVTRSIGVAPEVARVIADSLRTAESSGAESADIAAKAWDALWSDELRRQSSFQVFGMELLADLNLKEINNFFTTFFALPNKYWTGFLRSGLSSTDLLMFAFVFFLQAPNSMRVRLLEHLVSHPSGREMVVTYAAGAKKAYQKVLQNMKDGEGTSDQR